MHNHFTEDQAKHVSIGFFSGVILTILLMAMLFPQ